MFSWIKSHIKSYLQSSFVRNALKLMTGTAFAQVISILTAPILYRIYEKEDYGTLGLYMALVGSVGSFSTLQYTQAVILEKEDEDALQVLWLMRIINASLALLVFTVVMLGGRLIAGYLNNPDISLWLTLLPISIFFSGQNEVFRIWANRKKQYATMAWNSMLTAIIVPVISISFGLIYNSPLGLFLGLLTSQIVPALYMGWVLSKTQSFGLKTIQLDKIKLLAVKHVNFPKYSLPADFINRFSNQLPVFMLSAYAGPGVVGSYNLCTRMLGLPIQLISGAIGEIFRQRSTEDYHKYGNCKHIFLKTLKTLSLLAIPPLVVILLWGPDLFAWVFGEKWREAGLFSQILSGLFFLRFFASPLSHVFFIAGKQRQDLYWHILMLAFSYLSFYLGFEVLNSLSISLLLFSLGYSVVYIIYLYYSYVYSIGYTAEPIKYP